MEQNKARFSFKISLSTDTVNCDGTKLLNCFTFGKPQFIKKKLLTIYFCTTWLTSLSHCWLYTIFFSTACLLRFQEKPKCVIQHCFLICKLNSLHRQKCGAIGIFPTQTLRDSNCTFQPGRTPLVFLAREKKKKKKNILK